MSNFTRRQLIATAGAAAAAGWAPTGFAQAGTRLRAFWWGNPDRDKRTRALLEAYAKKTGMTISAESLGWGDYWTKLGTQVAGGNAPDLIQMDYRYLFEYARRETLLPLDSLLPLPDFSANDRNGGKVDGKLYGVNLGTNSKAMVYDVDMLAKAGAKSLDMAWTWDDFGRIAGEISKMNPGKYWGASDNSRWEQGFRAVAEPARQIALLVRRQGRLHGRRRGRLVRALGQVPQGRRHSASRRRRHEQRQGRRVRGHARPGGDELRELEPGGRVPGPEQEQARDPPVPARQGRLLGPLHQAFADDEHLVAQQVAGRRGQTRQLHGHRPGRREVPRHRTWCSLLGSSARGARARGRCARARCRSTTWPRSAKIAIPLPPPPPKGAGEIEKLLLRTADSVAFGKASIKDGAQQFHDEAVSILARA